MSVRLRLLIISVLIVGTVKCDNQTIGGTKLLTVPGPYLTVIPQYSTEFAGTYVGAYRAPSYVLLAFTSSPKDAAGYEVRTAEQEIVFGREIYLPDLLEPQISILEMDFSQGEWIPPPAKLIDSKGELQRLLNDGTEGKEEGFALGVSANPIKAFVVSWSQTGCEELYKATKYTSWPDDLPRGMFCVYKGKKPMENTMIDTIVYDKIEVATPCDDAVGSPVLLKDFDRVLGIIVRTICETPPYVAFAMSPAFLPEAIIPTTPPPPVITYPTEPPPPMPRIPLTSRPCAASATKISCCLSVLMAVTLNGVYAAN